MNKYLLALLFVGLLVISGCNLNTKQGASTVVNNASVITTTFTGLVSSQVVYGSATGNAGQTTDLTWRIASSSLGIGNNYPSSTLHIVNGTLTTTVILGSPASGTNNSAQCFWNGTNFTKISFPANSTTPTYSTSTSC